VSKRPPYVNQGWFKRGADARRHKWSKAAARRAGVKGWCAALQAHPQLYSWLIFRVRRSSR
jgi:hypothetical protein